MEGERYKTMQAWGKEKMKPPEEIKVKHRILAASGAGKLGVRLF